MLAKNKHLQMCLTANLGKNNIQWQDNPKLPPPLALKNRRHHTEGNRFSFPITARHLPGFLFGGEQKEGGHGWMNGWIDGRTLSDALDLSCGSHGVSTGGCHSLDTQGTPTMDEQDMACPLGCSCSPQNSEEKLFG